MSDAWDHYCQEHSMSRYLRLTPYRHPVRVIQPTQQLFWKCKHHPIATENFFEMRISCGFGCSATELRWHDNGTHRTVDSVLGV